MDAYRLLRLSSRYRQAHTEHNQRQLQAGYLQEDPLMLNRLIYNKKRCLHMKKKMCLPPVILDHTRE